MKKSINAFQVEKLEDRKEFTFYLLCKALQKGNKPTPKPNPGPVPN